MTADDIRHELHCGSRPGCVCAREHGNVHCPAHNDENPSLSVTERDGRILVHCHAGCSQESVIKALRARGLWPESYSGLTLEDLARAKDLRVDFLQSLGLRTVYDRDVPRVRVPYMDEQGEVVAIRFRKALNGAERFAWRRGDKPLLYGLWRLPEIRKDGWVLLLEGESDCLTAWLHDVPALGVPGKGTWRTEWAQHLDGLDVYLWCEPDAVDLVERVARVLPEVRVIVPPSDLKDLSEAHLHGKGVSSLIAQLKSEAPPAADMLRHQREVRQQREAEEALRQTAGLLDDPSLLGRIDAVLTQRGLAGDTRNARLIYLGLTSRLLSRPVNIAVEGPSAAGKTHLVNQVVALFPQEAVYSLTASSERLLAFAEEDFCHRVIVIGEAAGLHRDGVGATILRTLAWEGRLIYATVEKTLKGLRPRRIEKPGPTGFITTTTKPLDPELATRILSLTVRDDPDQTRAVVKEAALRAANGPAQIDLTQFIAAQRWLTAEGIREIVVPFAEVLAERVAVTAVRVRRDFVQLLTLIQASALLHQRQRLRDDRGRVVATLEDYRIVHDLVADVLGATVSDGLTPAQREAVEAVTALFAETGGDVRLRQVAERLGIDESSASRRLTRPRARGYVLNAEDRRGQPARYRPGEDVPAPRPAIPTPEILARACAGYASSVSPSDDCNTATPEPKAASDVPSGQYRPELQMGEHCAVRPQPAATPPASLEGRGQSDFPSDRCSVETIPEDTRIHRPPGGGTDAGCSFDQLVNLAIELFHGEIIYDGPPLSGPQPAEEG